MGETQAAAPVAQAMPPQQNIPEATFKERSAFSWGFIGPFLAIAGVLTLAVMDRLKDKMGGIPLLGLGVGMCWFAGSTVLTFKPAERKIVMRNTHLFGCYTEDPREFPFDRFEGVELRELSKNMWCIMLRQTGTQPNPLGRPGDPIPPVYHEIGTFKGDCCCMGSKNRFIANVNKWWADYSAQVNGNATSNAV